jgi:hypothetical protein
MAGLGSDVTNCGRNPLESWPMRKTAPLPRPTGAARATPRLPVALPGRPHQMALCGLAPPKAL